MTPRLSILICARYDRNESLVVLLRNLNEQKTDAVEILVDYGDPCGLPGDKLTIGDKRNRLLSDANGEWVCFIDDDDVPAPMYVREILKAADKNPDCIGFKVDRFLNGNHFGVAIHSRRFRFFSRRTFGRNEEAVSWPPNHLNPIRTSLARQTGFKSLNRGEDRDYAERLWPLLRTEVFIDKTLYFYMRKVQRGVLV
jgi:glycosyltransferase involved in cell wall biosynthesis